MIIKEIQMPESSDAEKKLVLDGMALVYSLAGRFTGRGVEYDDLVQSGALGLIEAARRFDGSRGIAFGAFAFKFIEGEMRSCIRKKGLIVFPKAINSRLAQIKHLFNAEKEAEHSPTDFSKTVSNTAKKFGVDDAKLREMLFEYELLSSTCSLDALKDEKDDNKNNYEPSDDSFEKNAVDGLLVKSLLTRLSNEKRRIIALRYFHNLTQQKIADLLGMSQSKVSKIEKNALAELREMMNDHIEYV